MKGAGEVTTDREALAIGYNKRTITDKNITITDKNIT